jgi:streptogramin lyase
LISFDPNQGKIKSPYPIITSEEKIRSKNNNTQSNQGFQMVWSIVEGNDGSIWFPEGGSDPLWRFEPTTDKFQVIHSISAAPMQMKVDQKTGNIWFTTFGSGTFGVIQKTSSTANLNSSNTIPDYKVTEFNLGNDSFPSGVFLQRGSVWITETLNHNKLVQFKPITSANGTVIGVTKLLEIPPSSTSKPMSLSQPYSAGSNGNNDVVRFTKPTDLAVFEGKDGKPSSIWLPEHGTSFITEYKIGSKSVMRFPTSASYRHYTTLPYWMAEAPGDKGFWFNEHEGNRISFFNTTDMTLTEYEVPTRDPPNAYISNALTLTIDPNDTNKTWFTEFNHDKIGVVDRSLIKLLSSSNNESQKNALSVAGRLNVITTNSANTKNNHTLLFLNASSSMNPLGRFVNVTAKFYPTPISDLMKGTRITQTHLILQRNESTSISPGNYTVGVSATNGPVTKSVFKDIVVKRLSEK